MSFDYADTGCFLCIDETLGSFQSHYLHSKIVIIDDKYLEVGSANNNNRSLLYDAEMSVVVFDKKWVSDAREEIMKEILGDYYKAGMPAKVWFEKLAKVAAANHGVYLIWQDKGFDLNLNGDPAPNFMIPKGFLYPLEFGAPNSCLITGVGPDVT
jgi:hypothetical protein